MSNLSIFFFFLPLSLITSCGIRVIFFQFSLLTVKNKLFVFRYYLTVVIQNLTDSQYLIVFLSSRKQILNLYLNGYKPS